jgi:hypothetical protein
MNVEIVVLGGEVHQHPGLGDQGVAVAELDAHGRNGGVIELHHLDALSRHFGPRMDAGRQVDHEPIIAERIGCIVGAPRLDDQAVGVQVR